MSAVENLNPYYRQKSPFYKSQMSSHSVLRQPEDLEDSCMVLQPETKSQAPRRDTIDHPDV